MAITKGAKKAHKQSLVKRVYNLRRSRAMKGEMGDFLKLIAKGDKAAAEKMLPDVYQAIDKATKRGVIKKNTASRKKSLVARKLASLK